MPIGRLSTLCRDTLLARCKGAMRSPPGCMNGAHHRMHSNAVVETTEPGVSFAITFPRARPRDAVLEKQPEWEDSSMPERYRVRYAHSADEVLRELQKFVDCVKTGPVMALLPSAMDGLSSHDADDVAKWRERIAHTLLHTRPLGAISECWLNLLDEMFRGAQQRLEELSHARAAAGGDAAATAAVPASSSGRPEAPL
jgi:hypothetical protein